MALYDPGDFPSEAPTPKVDAFTVAEFRQWVRRQPKGLAYDFCDPGVCAIARFGIETGRPHLLNLTTYELDDIHPGLSATLNPLFGRRTYGALARRLALRGLVKRLQAVPS